MSFLYYVAQSERTYCYRIKSVVPIDDDAMCAVERVLSKYDPRDISSVERTIYQATPVDFPEVRGGEVFIFDIKLGLPASVAVLQDELYRALNIPSSTIRVFGDGDPMVQQQEEKEAYANMTDNAAEAGMAQASLLTLPEYEEAVDVDVADHCGPDYTSRFLAYLKTVADERAEKMKIDAPFPITRWADQPKEEPAEDFNADLVQPIKADGKDIVRGPEVVARVYTDGKKLDRMERKVTDRSTR